MISIEKLNPILASYKSRFLSISKNEKYKWEAVKQFQDHWNINTENFADMFKKATDKTANLLASGYSYPRAMIIEFAKADAEATSEMFRALYDESQDLAVRVEAFQQSCEELRNKYNDGTWKNHYQKTDEPVTPDGTANIGGNMIGAKTLDLNVDFRIFAAQLDKIAFDFFGVKVA